MRRLSAKMRRITRRQQGAALILFLLVLVVGVTWYGVSALGAVSSFQPERDRRTAAALYKAKQALLAHVALMAADPAETNPGRLPCPENPTQVGTALEGRAAPFTTPAIACTGLGRLPWKDLGLDEIRDGYGEPLWYAVSLGTWTWTAAGTPPTPTLQINPGLAGQLSYDGAPNAAVAVIIAPGEALNLAATPGAPPAGCAAVDQQANRYAVPYAAASFLECGNQSGSFKSTPPSTWSNDRTIVITAAEVMDAISGAVADRVQRQVMPALAQWDDQEASSNGKSWGTTWSTPYLPLASPFGDPATNNYCGNGGASPSLEGLMPIAANGAGCNTDWTYVASSSTLLGLIPLGTPACTPVAGAMRCQYSRILGLLGTANIRLSAAHVAGAFRGTITSGDIGLNATGTKSLAMTLTTNPDQVDATITIGLGLPSLLDLLTPVTVTIPNLPDAAVLSDSRVAWFTSNQWQRYAYYAVAPGAIAAAAATCPTDPSTCLTVNGLGADTGAAGEKHLVVAFMGRGPVGAQTQPSGNATDYLESHAPGNTVFSVAPVDSMFNDRVATCPFQHVSAQGATVTFCN